MKYIRFLIVSLLILTTNLGLTVYGSISSLDIGIVLHSFLENIGEDSTTNTLYVTLDSRYDILILEDLNEEGYYLDVTSDVNDKLILDKNTNLIKELSISGDIGDTVILIGYVNNDSKVIYVSKGFKDLIDNYNNTLLGYDNLMNKIKTNYTRISINLVSIIIVLSIFLYGVIILWLVGYKEDKLSEIVLNNGFIGILIINIVLTILLGYYTIYYNTTEVDKTKYIMDNLVVDISKLELDITQGLPWSIDTIEELENLINKNK